MKSRIIIFLGLIAFAAGSLGLAAMWSKRMAGGADAVQIDHAEYLLHTWTITFVVASVAAVFVLINIVLHKRRPYDDNTQ